MVRSLTAVLCCSPLVLIGQLQLLGSGSERGEFIRDVGSGWVMGMEVEDAEMADCKFLVVAFEGQEGMESWSLMGEAPMALNGLLQFEENAVVLGEQYLENGRESLLMAALNRDGLVGDVVAFNENGNELEGLDATVVGDRIWVTGFAKTGEGISNGFAIVTVETRHVYLGRYNADFKKEVSYVISGLDEDAENTGRQLVSTSGSLFLAGNSVKDGGSLVFAAKADTQGQLDWSREFSAEGSLGVSEMIAVNDELWLWMTRESSGQGSVVLVRMNQEGGLLSSQEFEMEGMARSGHGVVMGNGDVVLNGVVGPDRFRTRRFALHKAKGGGWRWAIQGDGLTNECGSLVAKEGAAHEFGHEFTPGAGYDPVWRIWDPSDATQEWKGVSADAVSIEMTPLELTLVPFPAGQGWVDSELIKKPIRVAPYEGLRCE